MDDWRLRSVQHSQVNTSNGRVSPIGSREGQRVEWRGFKVKAGGISNANFTCKT